jgi:hypothetical protein
MRAVVRHDAEPHPRRTPFHLFRIERQFDYEAMVCGRLSGRVFGPDHDRGSWILSRKSNDPAPVETRLQLRVHAFAGRAPGAARLASQEVPPASRPTEFGDVRGALYAVTVTIKVTSGKVDANPLYFAARNAAGDSYDVALGATSDDLDSASVVAGQVLRGSVGFDVPRGQHIALVIYDDALGPQIASWRV